MRAILAEDVRVDDLAAQEKIRKRWERQEPWPTFREQFREMKEQLEADGLWVAYCLMRRAEKRRREDEKNIDIIRHRVRRLSELKECELLEKWIEAVRAGGEPTFVEMGLFRQSPGTRGTERTFVQGRTVSGMDGRCDQMRLANAKKAGVNTHGRMYVASLCRKGFLPGADPIAWVPQHDALGEIRAKAKKLGKTGTICNIEVNDVPEREPEPDCPLHPKIVKDFVQEYCKTEPGFAQKKLGEQKEIVIDRHGAKKKSKMTLKQRLKAEL